MDAIELTPQEMYDALVERTREGDVPESAFTLQKFCEDADISEGKGREILRTEIAAGRMEEGFFQRLCEGSDGVAQRRRCKYYWFVTPEESEE